MNRICKYIENEDFHIKQKVRSSSDFDYKILMSNNFTINHKVYREVSEIVDRTMKEWEVSIKDKMNSVKKSLSGGQTSNQANSQINLKTSKEIRIKLLKSELEEVVFGEEQLTNYLVYLFYVDRPSYSKSTLWGLVGKQMYLNVKRNINTIYFPVKNKEGNLKFLYNNYQIEKIDLPKIVNLEFSEEVEEMMNDGLFVEGYLTE